MRNPFKNSFRKRGLPDCGSHDGNPQQQTNTTPTLIPVSSSSSTASHSSMGSEPIVHPHAAHPYAAHTTNPPIAHPYVARPEQGESPGPVWEFNTGENINMKGHQSSGNIRGVRPNISGRFVCGTGKNYNEGDGQKSGDIEFGEDGSGAR